MKKKMRLFRPLLLALFCLMMIESRFTHGETMRYSNENQKKRNDAEKDAAEPLSRQYRVIFAAYAENSSDVRWLLHCAESRRHFAGSFNDCPFWIYLPDSLLSGTDKLPTTETAMNIEFIECTAPEKTADYFFGGKPYAAAKCETRAKDLTNVVVWLDPDTIFLDEPADFVLPEKICLKYRPVMHKNIGLLFSDSLDQYWSRVYELLSVPESTLFPMTTAAGGEIIRPYFNAGLLVLNPRCGLLAKWADYFDTLIGDSLIANLCRQDKRKNIFLFQVALTADILNSIGRDKMEELSDRYNYPIFFNIMFGASKPFDSIDSVITIRHEGFFSKPFPDWDQKLKGAPEKILWLKTNLCTAE
ncbi:exported hypothetical protein [Candidatus Zixiibacteriota bacterium]|nr:exported hypothetical protein [candidate division Zixibacteria bacterium]